MTTNFVPDLAVLAICLGYGIAVTILWSYQVASPRDWLVQRIDNLSTRIATEDWDVGEPGRELLAQVRGRLAKPWFKVPTSRVQAGWRQVHALEDQRILELRGDIVKQQLATFASHLAQVPGPEAESFAKRIRDELKTPQPDLELRRALLQETEFFLHNRSDSAYQDLASLLAKAVWLTWVALALVVALALLFDRESYLLFGAAGALISRLTRVLRRRPSSTDYGAALSTLILSPAAGALVGYVGVLIVVVLAEDPFNILGDRFAELWDDGSDLVGLIVAFVSGFSERAFNRLLGAAETQVAGALPNEDDE